MVTVVVHQIVIGSPS